MVKNVLKFFQKKSPPEVKEGPKEIIVKYDDLGGTGVKNYGGYLEEDYLSKMKGTERADIFDQMRRGDSNVKMLLSAVKNPIKSANWDVTPGDDSDQAFEDAEFIKHVLFDDMMKPFHQFLSEALTIVEFGFSPFEITHKAVVDHPKYKSYIGLKNLAWRSPRTIERWNIDRSSEQLISITQISEGDAGKFIDIPSQFILLFNLEQEGANFEGVSLLRACYGNWLRKNNYLKLNAAGIEKFAIPTPIVEVPDNKENSPEFTRLLMSSRNLLLTKKTSLQYPRAGHSL